MPIYTTVVIVIVILSSAVFACILRKSNLLNFRVLIAMGTSSIIVGLLFPLIFVTFSNAKLFLSNRVGIFAAFFTAIIVYITLVLFLSIIVSLIISNEKANRISCSFRNSAIYKFFNKAKKEKDIGLIDGAHNNVEKSVDSRGITDKMGVETIYSNIDALVPEIHRNSADLGENDCDNICISDTVMDMMELTLQIEEAKMGNFDIDNSIPSTNIFSETVSLSQTYEDEYEPVEGLAVDEACDQEVITIDTEFLGIADNRRRLDLDVDYNMGEYIDEAFRLKVNCDFEGAILYYMYALDKKPDKDLAIWIILDICVLYKALGQSELARDILENYFCTYNELLDNSIKAEIESNLLNI